MALTPMAIKNLTREEREQYYRDLATESGDNRILTGGEREHLPKVMMPDELLLWTSSGALQSTGPEGKHGGIALIALTDRRILILDKRLFAGIQTIAIDLDKVNSITGDTGMFFGGFKIQDGGYERAVGHVAKKSVLPFVQRVQRAIEARKIEQRQELMEPAPPQDDDIVSKLERLAALKDREILTDAEFEEQKAKLLAG